MDPNIEQNHRVVKIPGLGCEQHMVLFTANKDGGILLTGAVGNRAATFTQSGLLTFRGRMKFKIETFAVDLICRFD